MNRPIFKIKDSRNHNRIVDITKNHESAMKKAEESIFYWIDIDHMNTISRDNADALGKQTMIFQTIEECGELIKALSKLNRTHGIGQITEMTEEEAMSDVVTELADVEICIEQLKYLMQIETDEAKNRAYRKVRDRCGSL